MVIFTKNGYKFEIENTRCTITDEKHIYEKFNLNDRDLTLLKLLEENKITWSVHKSTEDDKPWRGEDELRLKFVDNGAIEHIDVISFSYRSPTTYWGLKLKMQDNNKSIERYKQVIFSLEEENVCLNNKIEQLQK